MHPILFRVPLPGWTIPLFPALLSLAVIGALLGVFGWRKRAIDLLAIGGAAAAAATIAAFSVRGQVYTLSPLPIYSYGAMLCLSIIVGWFLTLSLAEKDGLPRETMANCYFVTALAALVGARLLYVVTNLHEFPTLGSLFALRGGGLVAYGGFLGGFVGSWLYLRSKKLPLLPWADVAVPSLALGLVVTRIGCYLFGCDFGKPLSEGAPRWLKTLGTFPRWPADVLPETGGSPAWNQHVKYLGLSPDAAAALPVHPTQIYESIAGLVLLGLVFLVRKNQRFRGQVFLAFTFGYGVLRFLIETLRDDVERGVFGPHVAEHLLVPLVLVAFGAAFAYGPAHSITNDKLRRGAQVLAIVPALATFLWLRPESFAPDTLVQLSTSQWIGILTAVASGVVWSIFYQNAQANPDAAMKIQLPPSEEAEAEAEETEAEAKPKSAAQARKSKPQPRKSKKTTPTPEPKPEADDTEVGEEKPEPA
jgi:phosphatidylglycerol:prolipoprotein diacylglycerol transferase